MYRANAWIHAIGAGTLLPLLLTGTLVDGARGAALAVLVANLVTVLASLIVSLRATDYGPLQFMLRIWRPVVASTLMYGAIVFVSHRLSAEAPIVLRLAIEVLVGAVVYLAALATLVMASRAHDSAERLTLELVGRLWRHLRRRPA
jgi:Na+-driven multidrug efflux pump